MGSKSDIAWMQRLDLQPSKYDQKSLAIHWHHYTIAWTVELPKHRSDQLFWFATPGTCGWLIQLYMEHIHWSLPLVRKDLFGPSTVNAIWEKGTSRVRKWLAVLNMILAIACAFRRLSFQKLPPEADENFSSARARTLGISENVLYDHGDLQQLQAEVLMALLFLIQSQINRYVVQTSINLPGF